MRDLGYRGTADQFLQLQVHEIIDFLRIPTMFSDRDFVLAGGLMSYSPSRAGGRETRNSNRSDLDGETVSSLSQFEKLKMPGLHRPIRRASAAIHSRVAMSTSSKPAGNCSAVTAGKTTKI